jgi:hypothetical protein
MLCDEILEARSYPANRDTEWYGNANFASEGGRLVQMTPDQYLRLA